MTAKPVRVCPACRGVARSKPLPPEGFWQVQVLQRIGMYPYRCQGCGARFYRRVKISEDLATPTRSHVVGPPGRQGTANVDSSAAAGGPRVVVPSEGFDDGSSHADFVDLIGHISRSEQRKGLKERDKDRADE